MSNIAIKVENLSKRYLINHNQNSDNNFREMMVNKAKSLNPFAGKNLETTSQEEFWALKDINFEINQGDRVGVIGRNGAGKSTLLKTLSRITEPTKGKIHINGRIASLLEVGTGFHPELTGYENIFLNGAILGMSRKEIVSKFDDIVDFAGVEKFLDTPVKRYSSGMYVRLAFSVAAHLETEILIIDEVLAVGDASFQKKCLGRMENISKGGRTVIFVSHNMNAIERLCGRVILLDEGCLVENTSDMRALVKDYLFDANQQKSNKWVNKGDEYSNPWFKPLAFSITDKDSNLMKSPLLNHQEIWLQIDAEIQEIDPALTIGYAIYSEDGNLLYWSYQTDTAQEIWPKVKKGISLWRSKIPPRFLNEGVYRLELIGGLHFREWISEPRVNAPSIQFQIKGGLSESPLWLEKRPGLLAPVMTWEIL